MSSHSDTNTFFAGVAAQFTQLVLLELSFCLPLPDGTLAAPDIHLSSLTFLHLRDLRLTNNAAPRLALDAAHLPQLRALTVQGPVQAHTLQTLQLQLPLLLALRLDGYFLQGIWALAACLSEYACPRLRALSVKDVRFSNEARPCALVLDLPWVERFQLSGSGVTHLELRAPPPDGAPSGALQQTGGLHAAAGRGAACFGRRRRRRRCGGDRARCHAACACAPQGRMRGCEQVASDLDSQ
ncbi:MAG: hypothetical protein WDW36_006414 [Sanguina aurantia]